MELQALVIPINHESKVEIRKINGKLLLRKDFNSPDGEHGYEVVNAAWTPDSQFFVFALTSSGGHQPWRFPTYFYCRKHGKLRSLEDYLGAVTEPTFGTSVPDFIRIKVLGTRTYQESEGEIVEVSLGKFCK
jgi:hypothetical protein